HVSGAASGRAPHRRRAQVWYSRSRVSASYGPTEKRCRNKRGGAMYLTRQNLIRTTGVLLGLAALGAAFGLGTVVAQQPMPPTKVSQLMKQMLADVPGREVMMITLDIPPGGGSPAHRHPGAHNFGYVLEGAYKYKLDNGPETVVTKGQ